MKKKFLIVGDNHLDSSTPSSRLDNYMESGLMELKETLLIASAAKVDYYILLGDVFNRIEVGGECRNRALEILSSNDGVPWEFEKYVVIGNHDIAHNQNNLEKSALQTLISAGVIKCTDILPDLPVRFLHFSADLDEKLRQGIAEEYNEKILFMHASVVDAPMIFDYVLFKDLKLNNNTKLIFSGHIHRRMYSENSNGAKFFNPGSLGRPEISGDYEKHKVGVLLIQFDFDTNEFHHKYLELKNSMPYDFIFDLEKNKLKKIEDKNAELFIETVTNIPNSESSTTGNLENDFKLFAKDRKVKENIVKIAIDTINLVKSGGIEL
jgi:DNA repair exonuclease SbcCD nuclease subunit